MVIRLKGNKIDSEIEDLFFLKKKERKSKKKISSGPSAASPRDKEGGNNHHGGYVNNRRRRRAAHQQDRAGTLLTLNVSASSNSQQSWIGYRVVDSDNFVPMA